MKVYIDVTNTVVTGANTGIQRVCREIIHRLLNRNIGGLEIVLLREHSNEAFVLVDPGELFTGAALPDSLPESAANQLPLYPEDFEPFSVFLDMDASWHNTFRRSELLPWLSDQKVKIVRLQYDLLPIHNPEFAHPQTVERFTEHLSAHLECAHSFLCISSDVQLRLQDIACSVVERSVNSQVLRLGADFKSTLPDLTEPASRQLEALGFSSDKRLLLTVGTVEPRKNYSLLLDVFDSISAQYPDVTLVIAGKKGWSVDELVRRIETHPLYNSRLIWLKDTNDRELKELYRRASLFLYTSYYEGFGLPLVEALSAGLPSISFETGALSEQAGNAADLVPLGCKDEFISALRHYLDNPDALGERKLGLNTFEASSWDDTVTELVEFLKGYSPKTVSVATGDRYQVLSLSVNPETYKETLLYAANLMPYVDEAVVVCPQRLKSAFLFNAGFSLKVLTDEELLGVELDGFQTLDHQQKNYLLRRLAISKPLIRDEFIMLDDDARPLKPVDLSYFVEAQKYNGYYYYEMAQWIGTRAFPTAYDKGQWDTQKALFGRGYETLSYSCHAPQLINKAIYLEAIEAFSAESETLSLDEWSIYFNYASFHYPDSFRKCLFQTLCWPAYPSDWDYMFHQEGLMFENFYPALYGEGEVFAGIPSAFDENHAVHAKEKIRRRRRQQHRYEVNRELRNASVALSKKSDCELRDFSFSSDKLLLVIKALPGILFSQPKELIRLLCDLQSSPRSDDIQSLALFYHLYTKEGELIDKPGPRANLIDFSKQETRKTIELPIIPPDRPGEYLLSLNLELNHRDHFQPDSSQAFASLHVIER